MLENFNCNDNEKADSMPRNINFHVNFFTPSDIKLAMMSICTCGLYELYWFYKNWVILKKMGKECSPFWRTIFAPLFAYSCFWNIRESMIKNKVDEKLPIIFLALSYFILRIILSQSSWPYSLISLLSFWPVMIANTGALAVNKVHSMEFVSNNKFSMWNWFAIILGGTLIVVLNIIAFNKGILL